MCFQILQPRAFLLSEVTKYVAQILGEFGIEGYRSGEAGRDAGSRGPRCRRLQASAAQCGTAPKQASPAPRTPRTPSRTSCKQLTGIPPAACLKCFQDSSCEFEEPRTACFHEGHLLIASLAFKFATTLLNKEMLFSQMDLEMLAFGRSGSECLFYLTILQQALN